MTAALTVVPKAPDESVTGSVVPLRPYDAPGITARLFLQACMRSPNVSLALRIDAANKLLKLEPPESTVVMVDNEEPVVRYIIGGIKDA